MIHKDGETIDCLLSAETITVRGAGCVLWLYQDISARRHSELELVDAIQSVMKDASWFSHSIMDNWRRCGAAILPPRMTQPRHHATRARDAGVHLRRTGRQGDRGGA